MYYKIEGAISMVVSIIMWFHRNNCKWYIIYMYMYMSD